MIAPKHLTRYTCPTLMWVQWAALRIARRPVYVTDGTIYRRTPRGHGVEVRCWWPMWAVLAEHRIRRMNAERGV